MKSKVKRNKFGKLVSLPNQLLTRKFLKECSDEDIQDIKLEEVKIKSNKGKYLVFTRDEKELLSHTKKPYKKTCYISLKKQREIDKRLALLRGTKKTKKRGFFDGSKVIKKAQEMVKSSPSNIIDLFSGKARKEATHYNNFIKLVEQVINILSHSELLEKNETIYLVKKIKLLIKFNETPSSISEEKKKNYLDLIQKRFRIDDSKYKIKLENQLNQFQKNQTELVQKIKAEFNTMDDFRLNIDDVSDTLFNHYINLIELMMDLRGNYVLSLYDIYYKLSKVVINLLTIISDIYLKQLEPKQPQQQKQNYLSQEAKDQIATKLKKQFYVMGFIKDELNITLTKLFRDEGLVSRTQTAIQKDIEAFMTKIIPEVSSVDPLSGRNSSRIPEEIDVTTKKILFSKFSTYNLQTQTSDYKPFFYVVSDSGIVVNQYNLINTPEINKTIISIFNDTPDPSPYLINDEIVPNKPAFFNTLERGEDITVIESLLQTEEENPLNIQYNPNQKTYTYLRIKNDEPQLAGTITKDKINNRVSIEYIVLMFIRRLNLLIKDTYIKIDELRKLLIQKNSQAFETIHNIQSGLRDTPTNITSYIETTIESSSSLNIIDLFTAQDIYELLKNNDLSKNYMLLISFVLEIIFYIKIIFLEKKDDMVTLNCSNLNKKYYKTTGIPIFEDVKKKLKYIILLRDTTSSRTNKGFKLVYKTGSSDKFYTHQTLPTIVKTLIKNTCANGTMDFFTPST